MEEEAGGRTHTNPATRAVLASLHQDCRSSLKQDIILLVFNAHLISESLSVYSTQAPCDYQGNGGQDAIDALSGLKPTRSCRRL
jgi:hypothetical protein